MDADDDADVSPTADLTATYRIISTTDLRVGSLAGVPQPSKSGGGRFVSATADQARDGAAAETRRRSATSIWDELMGYWDNDLGKASAEIIKSVLDTDDDSETFAPSLLTNPPLGTHHAFELARECVLKECELEDLPEYDESSALHRWATALRCGVDKMPWKPFPPARVKKSVTTKDPNRGLDLTLSALKLEASLHARHALNLKELRKLKQRMRKAEVLAKVETMDEVDVDDQAEREFFESVVAPKAENRVLSAKKSRCHRCGAEPYEVECETCDRGFCVKCLRRHFEIKSSARLKRCPVCDDKCFCVECCDRTRFELLGRALA